MEAEEYKGYRIEQKAYRLKSGAWSARALIIVKQGGRITFSPIYGGPKKGFKTKEEAIKCALDFAKWWIDRHRS